jgi:hypothetical protein
MPCRGSENISDFLSEVCVHFRKPNNLTKPPVFVFPILTVCLDCDFTEFVFPKEALRQLTSAALDTFAKRTTPHVAKREGPTRQ